ncbi:hypothetical protein Cme02nite_28670 [Catellatospora methionotrophica]|uniref:Asp23/Gls24 family envelope stress response protein n=1 Tax=Catellatospora methionotrophica TaxID=121620 RepID=A0A8J3LKR5_9ACTN|nr:Asp23/Gls24 family envelope stress response protein [Catellatospora methionotrophica]GIG14535.1 hypothetical protein Cme02nite_28670 [Catellatospora methionotrophica]
MTATTRQPPAPPSPAHADSASAATGAIHISEDVIAKLASQAAGELPDVGGPHGLARLPGADIIGGKADLTRRPKAVAHLDGGRADLELAVSVRWPASLPEVTTTLRDHVRARVEQLTGLPVGAVDIEVTDLLADNGAGTRVH